MLVILYVSVNISKQSNLCPSSEQSCCHHPLPAESPLSPDTEKKQIYRRSWVLAGGGRGEDQEVCSAQLPDPGCSVLPEAGALPGTCSSPVHCLRVHIQSCQLLSEAGAANFSTLEARPKVTAQICGCDVV